MMLTSLIQTYGLTVAASVTAAAATTAAAYARAAARRSRTNARILRGEEDVEEWKGVVDMVHEHREALHGADLLDRTDADRDEVEA